MNTTVYVFTSIISIWKMSRISQFNESEEKYIDYFAFIWDVSSRRILQEIKKNNRSDTVSVSEFQGRILFMSMIDDIE